MCLEFLRGLDGFDFRGEKAFRRWLYQAAERKIVDRVRYWRAERRDAELERHMPTDTDSEDDPELGADLLQPGLDRRSGGECAGADHDGLGIAHVGNR